jgi:hypothetical protein
MGQSWFYQHQGKTHGPVSAEDLRELASKGLLDRDDLIWPEGAGQAEATPAHAALDFTSLAPAALDWLADVQSLEQKGPAPPPVAEKPEDWLEDLRLWFSLDLWPAKQAGTEPAAVGPPAPAGRVPDWLAAWSDAPSVPQIETVPSPAAAAARKPQDILAEQALAETGFDLKTGQILDPVKFDQWKQTRAGAQAGPGSPTNAALMEVFRTARREIDRWVDHEQHRAFIVNRTPAEIVRIAEVGGLLKKYAEHGPVLKDKLLQHLAFMVENRKKYYQVVGRA